MSFVPGDYSVRGGLSDLSPLSGLTSLAGLSLQGTSVTNGSLIALGGLGALADLDLRYTGVTDVSAAAGLTALKSVLVYGSGVTDIKPLAKLAVNSDLTAQNPEGARTVAELAAALRYSPLRMFEHVLNAVEFQPYAGQMKGPQATLETKAGNDWDQASLLAGLLNAAGVATRYVSGRIQAPAQAVMDWLGVKTKDAAANALGNIGLIPVAVTEGGALGSFQFTHTWLEGQFLQAGAAKWMALDPSWKFRDFQAGVVDMLARVPFDQADYLSTPRKELTFEYYAGKVKSYLASSMPGVSVADVAYDGPIRSQQVTALPGSLPYVVGASPTVSSTVPNAVKHRVGIRLAGRGTIFSGTYAVADIGLKRITIGYVPAPGGLVIPQFVVDGQVIAQGEAVGNRTNVRLTLTTFDPGDDVRDGFADYDRPAGQNMAIGIFAQQVSDSRLVELQRAVNDANVAALNNQPFNKNDQIGGLLALAVNR